MKKRFLPLIIGIMLLSSCAMPENVADEKIFQDKVVAHKNDGAINYSFKTLNDDTYNDSNIGTFTYYEFKTNSESIGTRLNGLWFCIASEKILNLYFSVVIVPLDFGFDKYVEELLKKDENNQEQEQTSNDKAEEDEVKVIQSDILNVETYENDLTNTSILFDHYITEPVKIILTISDEEDKIINPYAEYEIGLCEFYFSCLK